MQLTSWSHFTEETWVLILMYSTSHEKRPLRWPLHGRHLAPKGEGMWEGGGRETMSSYVSTFFYKRGLKHLKFCIGLSHMIECYMISHAQIWYSTISLAFPYPCHTQNQNECVVWHNIIPAFPTTVPHFLMFWQAMTHVLVQTDNPPVGFCHSTCPRLTSGLHRLDFEYSPSTTDHETPAYTRV